jgi:uncharacterized membrane protein
MRRRRARGATLLFFLGGMLPLIFLSMMLAADLTRIIDAQRQAAYVAENAAIAATLQYAGTTARIDTGAATRAARETAQASFDRGVMKHAAEPRIEGIRFATRSGTDTATVTVTYRIERLLVAQYFVGADDRRMAAARTAEVCVAESSAAQSVTRGFCSRPRARLG